MKLPVFGADISQEWLDLNAPKHNLCERFCQNTSGFKLILKRFKALGIKKARICMEATGLYFEKLAEFLHAHGHEVVVVNPQCIKAFSRSELRRSKSDPLDAALIAKYCEQKYDELHLWQPLPADYKQVREILRRRQAIVDMRTAEKNRLKAGFSCDSVLTSIKETIAYFDQEVKTLESLAFEIINNSPEFKRLVDLADSIGGISRLTAAVILTEVPQALWTGRLAAAFAGVVPHNAKSGKSLNHSYLSRVGNARIRCALYMPAVVASGHNPLLKVFYQRLLSRGLKKKQAIVAVMRKLLHLIFGVITTGIKFDPGYHEKRRLLAA